MPQWHCAPTTMGLVQLEAARSQSKNQSGTTARSSDGGIAKPREMRVGYLHRDGHSGALAVMGCGRRRRVGIQLRLPRRAIALSESFALLLSNVPVSSVTCNTHTRAHTTTRRPDPRPDTTITVVSPHCVARHVAMGAPHARASAAARLCSQLSLGATVRRTGRDLLG